MTVRRPLGSSSRSSQAWYSQTAACSFERAVPPSPNMMQLYQTNVRVSILYLQTEPHNPAHHATKFSLPSPTRTPSSQSLLTTFHRPGACSQPPKPHPNT